MNLLHVLTVYMLRQALCLHANSTLELQTLRILKPMIPIAKWSQPKPSTPQILTLDLRNLSELPEVLSLESQSRPLSAVSHDLYSYASGTYHGHQSKIQYVYILFTNINT